MYIFPKNRIKLLLLLLVVGLFFTLGKNVANAAFNYPMLGSFPGFFDAGQVMNTSTSNDFPALILAIYKFAIWTVGIAGLFMLVIGGFMYMASAGNTSTASNARGIINDAIIGIVAVLSAYLIIYVINPDLTVMKIGFTPVEITETAGSGNSTGGISTGNTNSNASGTCTGTSAGCCKAGVSCVTCKGNCVNFSNGYSALCYIGAPGNTGCKLNSDLAGKLNNANLSSVNAEVSEAWPPTMSHMSICHQDGTCADVRCKIGCKNETVANIKKIYDKIKSSGLNPVFENADCSSYTAAGIYCKSYPTMTAPSFHVNM